MIFPLIGTAISALRISGVIGEGQFAARVGPHGHLEYLDCLHPTKWGNGPFPNFTLSWVYLAGITLPLLWMVPKERGYVYVVVGLSTLVYGYLGAVEQDEVYSYWCGAG
jgi:hypothetical protein